VAAKKEKAASKRAKVSTGKLPDDVKAIKAELNALAARQAALLKKLEKAIEGGAKKKAAPKKKAAAEDSEDEEASDEEASDEEEEEVAEEEDAKDEAAPSQKEEPPPPSPAVATSAPTAPTDEELEYAVKEMLAGVNLESVSMKKIRVDLEEKFGVPLNDKKSIIKEFAEKYIS
jgi:protein DEK